LNSDTTLVHVVDAQSTPIESVNQRVSLAARIPSRLWTRDLLLGQCTWQCSNAAVVGRTTIETGIRPIIPFPEPAAPLAIMRSAGEYFETQGHRLAIGGIDTEKRGLVTEWVLDGASADAR